MGKRSKSKIKPYSQLIEGVRALGLSGRSAKKMARLCMVRNMEFSEFEKKFIEDHPQYQNKVSDFVQDVKRYTGFRVNEEGVPLINVEWQDSEEPLAFVNIEINESEQDFTNSGNGEQFTALQQYVDDHPEYLERLFCKEYEVLPNKDSESEEEPKPEEDPNPRGKSPRKAPRKHPRSYYLVGPPNH